jgi:hypothetical protein
MISDAPPFGWLLYTEVANAIDSGRHRRRLHNAVIRVYDDAGNVIETRQHQGRFQKSRDYLAV